MKENKIPKGFRWVLPALIVCILIPILILTIFTKSKGTVTETRRGRKNTHIIKIEYQVDGKSYIKSESLSKFYRSFMKTGDKLTVFSAPNMPKFTFIWTDFGLFIAFGLMLALMYFLLKSGKFHPENSEDSE